MVPVDHAANSPRCSHGGRDGGLGGVSGVLGRVRSVAVGVRLALQGEDAAQPADEGGREVEGQEEAAFPGEKRRTYARLGSTKLAHTEHRKRDDSDGRTREMC